MRLGTDRTRFKKAARLGQIGLVLITFSDKAAKWSLVTRYILVRLGINRYEQYRTGIPTVYEVPS
jgi:hypothetical protein